MTRKPNHPDRTIPIEKIDQIHNTTISDRERALQALARAKEIEQERKSQLISIQADPRTIITANPEKAAQLAAQYLDQKHS